MDGLLIPDMIGEVKAWRAWDVQWYGKVPFLWSATHKTWKRSDGSTGSGMWPPNRWYVAECPRGHQHPDIPVESCSCGLYAAKDLDQLVDLGYGRMHYDENEKVLGEVGFAGKVIEGSQGWRAARGRIVRLWVPLHHYEWVAPLGRLYRVPVGVADWRQIGMPELIEEVDDGDR
jgi:hypothetical protein